MSQPVKTHREEQKPFNAGDAGQVAEREKAAKRREDRRIEGLKFIMGDRRGRAWMRHLIAEKLFTRVGKQRPTVIFTGNSATFYNAALKEMGDHISAEIATLCGAEFRLMEDEGEANA